MTLTKQSSHPLIYLFLVIAFFSCKKTDPSPKPRTPEIGIDVLFLPVVVHVMHSGQTIGQGPNLADQRIMRQIEILNEDFRRKEGTRGFNTHPEGGDTKIEFVLATMDPNGNPTNGIHRIDTSKYSFPSLGYNQNHFAQYTYWDPESYINIWTTPLPVSFECLILGTSTGPETDLPGTEYLQVPGPFDAEGILVNWIHFGESKIDCHARYGRTLTHEMGHYLRLLHPWGGKDCQFNDFCADTPAVDVEVFGSQAFPGCSEEIMISNYMNYADDEIMNIFTKDQIKRMHYVLKNHQGRNKLIQSPALSGAI